MSVVGRCWLSSFLCAQRDISWRKRHHLSVHVRSQDLGLLRDVIRVQEENIRTSIYIYLCILKNFWLLCMFNIYDIKVQL